MIYKYERVSTKKQSQGRQEMILDSLGVKFDKTFSDKATGKNVNREGLNELRLTVKKGDIVYVESISRLGRNVDDLRALCEEFKSKGVTVNFAKEGINTNGDGYKFILTILGAVAEMERENTVERVQQGVARCIETGSTKTGNWFGRKEVTFEDLPKEFKKYYDKWTSKEITATEFAKLLGTSRATLYRWVKIYENK